MIVSWTKIIVKTKRLLVEQKLTIALKISQRVYVMGRGKIVYSGTPNELRENEAIRKEWLEVWHWIIC